MPRRMRPLMVPSGTFSILAISEWLKPPKKAKLALAINGTNCDAEPCPAGSTIDIDFTTDLDRIVEKGSRP